MSRRWSAASVASVRRAVSWYGLRVECLLCAWIGRHFTHEMGRLRDRPCPHCGRRSLRSRAWIWKHPELALAAQVRSAEQARISDRRPKPR